MESAPYEKSIFEGDEMPVEYAGFWVRLRALIVDGLALGVLSYFIAFCINFTNLTFLNLVSPLISACYKPLLEYKFGATLGKMIVKIKVIGSNQQLPSLKAALLRNIVTISLSFITIVYRVIYEISPEILNYQFQKGANTVDNFFYSFTYSLRVGVGLFYIVDAIFLLTDKVTKRALHDRIGNTYVILK